MTHNTYRFKFSDDIMQIITEFSKIHQFEDRNDYKESWKEWCEDNSEFIETETRRLTNLGYKGDVINKMYKAGRYYFRKKNLSDSSEAKKRRMYIAMDSTILSNMDKHILNNIKSETYSPAEGYSEFCKDNIELLKTEVNRLINNGITGNDIASKIKKTYKNRYYIISRNDEQE